MNNYVQKVVGEDMRVVLGFPRGTGPMPHPPCAAFITEKIRFFDLELGYEPKIEQIFIFYFLKIVRLFREDIVKVGSRNVPRPWKPLRAGLGDITSPEPATPGPARSYLVLLCSGGGNVP